METSIKNNAFKERNTKHQVKNAIQKDSLVFLFVI